MRMTNNRPTRALAVAGVLLAVAGSAFWLGRDSADALPALTVPKAAEREPAVQQGGDHDAQRSDGMRRMQVGEDDPNPRPLQPVTFVSELEMIKAHLGRAPHALEVEATANFETVARSYDSKVTSHDQGQQTWQSALAQLDARFSSRLQRVAIERIAAGRAVLVVGGLDYDHVVGGKKHLLWFDGRRQFDRSTALLVVIDPPDDELERLDREYWDVRLVKLAEAVTPFNCLPFEVRSERIRQFMEDKAKNKATGSVFGVDDNELRFLEIDPKSMVVVPRDRLAFR